MIQMSDTVRVALIMAGGGALGYLFGAIATLIGHYVKRSANGKLLEAKAQNQFYRDLQSQLDRALKRIEQLEAQLNEESEARMQHEALIIELSARIKAHLDEHPRLADLYSVLTDHETRIRRRA